jgi:hypothetical protein
MQGSNPTSIQSAHRARRLLLALILPLLLVGCRSWRTADVDALFDARSAQSMRTTLTDGTVMDIQNSFLRNDSIYGQGPRAAVQMPLSRVESIQVMRFSPTRTTALLVAHATVVVGFIAWVIHLQPHYQGF